MRLPSLTIAVAAAVSSVGLSQRALCDERLQVLRNGSFEEDEVTLRGEPASSCGGYHNDQWFNMQDLFPDGWSWPGVLVPRVFGAAGQSEWPRREVTLDKSVRRSGAQSLRLEGKAATVDQRFEWNTLNDLYRDDTAGPAPLLVKPEFFQEIVLEGWAKTKDVPQDARAIVSIELAGLPPASVELAKGTTDWQRFELRLPKAPQVHAYAKNKAAVGGTLAVNVSYSSPSGAGQIWLDDVSVSPETRREPNLLANASFEAVVPSAQAPPPDGRGTELSGAAALPAESPYPEGWTRLTKWTYLSGPYYYVWNNWQHFLTEGRGTPRLDSLVSHSGQRSLRFDLLGGDEYSIQSAAIPLHQREARPLEVTAWIKADRLRHFDLILVDQDGRRLPSNTTLTYWGGHLGGTHGWVALRKVFQGFAPVKSVRLRIGARGFNGTTKTDIGHWHAYNQVSTLWVDDAVVREMYSTPSELAQREVPIPAAVAPSGAIRISDLDLGERLFGENEAAAVIHNGRAAPVSVALEVQLTTPSGKQRAAQRGGTVSIAAGGSGSVTAPYALTELSPSWRKPGRIRVALVVDGQAIGSEAYGYGTWPVLANIRPSKAFLDQTENPILLAINLGVTKKTLGTVKRLAIEVLDRRSGKSVLSQEIADVAAAIATAKIQNAANDRFYFYMPRAGLLDHRNLILKELDISALPLRPWHDPESDWVVRVTGKGDRGDVFTSDSHPFARLSTMDEQLEPIREVTIDPVGKFFRVNGKPFLPLAQSHGNGAGLGGAPPSRSVRFGPEHIKVNGLNAMARWSGKKVLDTNWQKAKVYGPMLMSGTSAFHGKDAALLNKLLPALAQDQIMVAATGSDGALESVDVVNNSPSAIAWLTSFSEAILEVVSTPEHLKEEAAYADAARRKLNRPVGIMDNHSQFYPWHDDDGFLDSFDALYLEREAGAMFRPELALRNWMKRKQRWVVVDLPQTYENVPFERERYRAILNMLNGARGWFGIQGCADPSLYRGLGGQLRFIFSYQSANQGTVQPKAPAGIHANAWKKDDRFLVIADQHNPVPHGRWTWTQIDGRRAHSGVSSHLVTPVKEGYAVHGYNDDVYREIGAGDAIEQDVYIPPDKKPQAIFLIVPGNGDFNHVAYWGDFDHSDFRRRKLDAFLAGECYSAAAYGINWNRAAVDTWAAYQAAHRFPASAFVRMGDLPATGKWTTLNVPLERLKLTGRAVDGLMFMTSGAAAAQWGKSVLVRSNGTQDVMIDGRIGRDPESFRNTVFTLPGLSGSGTVRVVGENRTLKLTAGHWTDDLHGEDLFDCLREGWLGDGISYGRPIDSLPEALELSYTYDNSPRCVRVYEIIADQ